MSKESYGAKVEFVIVFDGNLQELTSKISKGLSIPEFWYDNMESPPHSDMGFCEVFGFEIEIKEKQNEPNKYLFTAITTDSFDEIANGRMYDFSTWFSKYLSFACKLEVMPL